MLLNVSDGNELSYPVVADDVNVLNVRGEQLEISQKHFSWR